MRATGVRAGCLSGRGRLREEVAGRPGALRGLRGRGTKEAAAENSRAHALVRAGTFSGRRRRAGEGFEPSSPREACWHSRLRMAAGSLPAEASTDSSRTAPETTSRSSPAAETRSCWRGRVFAPAGKVTGHRPEQFPGFLGRRRESGRRWRRCCGQRAWSCGSVTRSRPTP